MALGKGLAVSVPASICVGADGMADVGKLNSKVGVDCIEVSGGGDDSARASEIPPMTNMMETRAMMTKP